MTEVEYVWVLCKRAKQWLVSTWGGAPVWVDMDGVKARPDREFGSTVVRRIGNGYIAEHYRFEWAAE